MINGNDKRVASSIASSKRNPSCLTFPSSPCHSYFQTLHLVLFFAIGLSFYRPVFRPLTGRGRFKQVLTPEQYEQFVSVFPSPYEVRSFQTPVPETPCPTGALKPVCGGRLFPTLFLPSFISKTFINAEISAAAEEHGRSAFWR